MFSDNSFRNGCYVRRAASSPGAGSCECMRRPILGRRATRRPWVLHRRGKLRGKVRLAEFGSTP